LLLSNTTIRALSIFARSVGGRLLPAFIAPSGLDSVLQPHWEKQSSLLTTFRNATTAPIQTGVSAVVVGTATTRNVAVTNIYTRIKRLGYVSVATAGGLCDILAAQQGSQFTTGMEQVLVVYLYGKNCNFRCSCCCRSRMFIE
jgi:hypothetical protein